MEYKNPFPWICLNLEISNLKWRANKRILPLADHHPAAVHKAIAADGKGAAL
jgi:hypothetical protein